MNNSKRAFYGFTFFSIVMGIDVFAFIIDGSTLSDIEFHEALFSFVLMVSLSVFMLKKSKSDSIKEKEKEQREEENEKKLEKKFTQKYEELSQIELIDGSVLPQKIQENEKSIIDKGGVESLQDLVKLSTYSRKVEKRIEELYMKIPQYSRGEVISNWGKFAPKTFINKFDKVSKQFKSSIEFHREINLIGLTMLENIIDDEKTKYLFIRSELDAVGVFNSEYENQVLSKLDNIESNLYTVSNQLNDISKKIDLQNAISIVNTYHLSSISKKLDS